MAMVASNDDIQMLYKKLGETDINISQFCLGGSPFGNVFGFCSEDEVIKIISTAFKNGVNFIDTSPFYGLGRSETVIGKVLSSLNRERKSFYISTKVGRYGVESFDYSSPRVITSIKESLQRLQLDYVDIVFAHDIEFAPSLDIILNETLPTLSKLRDEGQIRYIGISGYPLDILKEVIERSQIKIDVVLTYCHFSINDTTLLDYIPYFKSKNVGILNAAPLSMGLLSPSDPMEWHPASDEIKSAARRAAQYCKEKDVSIAKLAVNFSFQNDDIDGTISSCINEKYLKENICASLSRLNSKEETALQHIKQHFFDQIAEKTWKSGRI